MPYSYAIAPTEPGQPAMVIIRMEEASYWCDANQLKNALFHLKDNKRAYVNEALYNNILTMLDGALRFLLEEQS